MDRTGINAEFTAYYAQPYSSSTTSSPDEIKELLGNIPLPTITHTQREQLELDITVEEVEHAIYGLKSGKATGPNSIPIELYKILATKLAPRMLKMYEESASVGVLPADQRMATIVVLPKAGKSPHKCASYRPISLLNAEAKILAKVLATRLIPLLPALIHPDQSGFMPHRSTALNLRRLHGVLAQASKILEDAVIFSLDARKAFDMVEWGFLFAVLERFGLGPKFINWVRLLYTHSMTRVKLNDGASLPFELQRSTRQGYPLSPLLFAMALEPLVA